MMLQIIFARLYYWAANRLYDEFAWAYDWISWLVSFGQWDAYRSQVLDYIQGSRILEVGFGTGEILLKLTREDFFVVGVDASETMQRITRRKINKHGMECKTVLGRTQNLPFSPDSFDCIISTFPAEFICDPDTFHEFRRVLSNSDIDLNASCGRVVVCGAVFNRNNGLINRLFRFLLGEPDKQATELFSTLAREAGFKISIIQPKDDKIQLPVLLFEVN
jgi:ubiquinone/menaquinone biosynthesis C-methylase UbiE